MRIYERKSRPQLTSMRQLPYAAGTSWFDAKLATIHFIKALKLPNPKILDLGIGRGELGFFLKKYGVECELTGIEICEVDLTETSCSSYETVYIADVVKELTPEFLSGFDVVVWNDVIEHLEITEAARIATMIVQSSRYSIISTPNFRMTQTAEPQNPWQEHKCYLDFHSMKSLNPRMCHFTLYGCGTYFFKKNDSVADFTNSKVTRSKMGDHNSSLNITHSGFYSVLNGTPSLQTPTSNGRQTKGKGFDDWYE